MYENIKDIEINPSKLKALKSMLKHGDITAISKLSEVNRETVKQVLNGRHFNEAVIKATIQRIQQRNEYKQSIEQSIDQVTKSPLS